jgi:hypothetical protein
MSMLCVMFITFVENMNQRLLSDMINESDEETVEITPGLGLQKNPTPPHAARGAIASSASTLAQADLTPSFSTSAAVLTSSSVVTEEEAAFLALANTNRTILRNSPSKRLRIENRDAARLFPFTETCINPETGAATITYSGFAVKDLWLHHLFLQQKEIVAGFSNPFYVRFHGFAIIKNFLRNV